MKLSIKDLRADNDLKIYFNWTANVLMPVYTGAADRYYKIHKDAINKVARDLIKPLDYLPGTIYRGIILREPVNCIIPHRNFKYLSFSTARKIAEHFADINGFGSEIVDITSQLGSYGYIIEHSPEPEDILFHHSLLDILPYSEAFTKLGLDGDREVNGLKKQKEVVIEQPAKPFFNIKSFKNESTIHRSDALY